MLYNYEEYKKTSDFIKERLENRKPKIAIVLGSGLGDFIDEVQNKMIIKYEDIPGFPVSTVDGHIGELVIGEISGEEIIVMNGRFHYYEGYDLKETTFPIRVFKLLGIENLILTNAAGAINKEFNVGDFMVIDDYLSLFEEAVLRGKNIVEFGDRFTDMTETFNREMNEKLKNIIKEKVGVVREGVYAYMKGPAYESPAEIRALRVLGADSVGMSTIPEAIVAHHCDIKTVGISCITNMAAGVSEEKLSHEEVKEITNRVSDKFKEIIKEFIAVI